MATPDAACAAIVPLNPCTTLVPSQYTHCAVPAAMATPDPAEVLTVTANPPVVEFLMR